MSREFVPTGDVTTTVCSDASTGAASPRRLQVVAVSDRVNGGSPSELATRVAQVEVVRVQDCGSVQDGRGPMRSTLRVGDWVEIRSKGEILQTLDSNGRLEGMPFMPEMFQFCGSRFQVVKMAHKTCDTVLDLGGRRLNAVHLETRCDGRAHDGCEASCRLFWKEAWLNRLGEPRSSRTAESAGTAESTIRPGANQGCTERAVYAATVAEPQEQDREPRYICQNTQIPYATSHLPWWDYRQYVLDFVSGNASAWRIVKGAMYWTYYGLSQAGIGLGPLTRWLYNKTYRLWRGIPWPRSVGPIPSGQPTPALTLDLQPGEWVRVRSHVEILKTLTAENMNRGMRWDAEMMPYCGGVYRVLKRVNKVINEKTGMMASMKTPGVILEDVVCQARYTSCRMFCPREFYSYWREIWLERVNPTDADRVGTG